jgi:hypothetical protein
MLQRVYEAHKQSLQPTGRLFVQGFLLRLVQRQCAYTTCPACACPDTRKYMLFVFVSRSLLARSVFVFPSDNA